MNSTWAIILRTDPAHRTANAVPVAGRIVLRSVAVPEGDRVRCLREVADELWLGIKGIAQGFAGSVREAWFCFGGIG